MKTLTKTAIIAGLAMFGASVVMAGPVEERKELMKSVGKSTKQMGMMVKGKIPYNGGQATQAMKTIADVAGKIGALYPVGTENDPDSTAGPKIWSDMAGFKKGLEAMKVDATAGAAAAGSGEGAFKAAFGKLVKNCKSCHEVYRIKKQ